MSAFADDFRDFAFDLVRSHARLLSIPDSPTRVGAPDEPADERDFDDLADEAYERYVADQLEQGAR